MPTLAKSKSPTKASLVSTRLRQLAQEAGPDGKLPTHSELLATLGVSGSTLNAALDELENQRVLYRRHGVGIFAAPEQSKTSIALACNPNFFKGSAHSPFWDLLIREARERADADDLSCEIHFCKVQGVDDFPFSESLSHALTMGHVQGMLTVGMNRGAGRWLSEKFIPHVSFGGPGTYHVALDIAAIIEQGVRALASVGCRQIALLSPVPPFKPQPLRDDSWSATSEVFRMTLARHGLAFDPGLVKEGDDIIRESGGVTTLLYREQGYRSARRIFEDASMEAPDGLVITDDMMTLGVLAALRELELGVGTDLQIASHANRGSAALASVEASLFRLEVDPAEIVGTMFSTMLDILSGKKARVKEINPRIEVERALIQPVLRLPGEVGATDPGF